MLISLFFWPSVLSRVSGPLVADGPNLIQVQHGPQGEAEKTETTYYQADESDRRYGFIKKRFELLPKEKENPQGKSNKVAGIARNILKKVSHSLERVKIVRFYINIVF